MPCALAAVVLRVPLVLAESNARAGAANRLVARFAKASAVAFPGTGLPRAELTGNPVRAEVGALADRIVVIDKGALLQEGTPATVSHSPANEQVREILDLDS